MNTDNVKAWLAIAGLAAGFISAAPVMAQPVALRCPEEGQVRALLVGIDAYRNVRPLKGAVSDARDIESALRRSGVNDVTVLLDERANRDAVIGAIESLTPAHHARRSGDDLDRGSWRAGAGARQGLAARRDGHRLPAAGFRYDRGRIDASASSGRNSTTSSSGSSSGVRACCSLPIPVMAAA